MKKDVGHFNSIAHPVSSSPSFSIESWYTSTATRFTKKAKQFVSFEFILLDLLYKVLLHCAIKKMKKMKNAYSTVSWMSGLPKIRLLQDLSEVSEYFIYIYIVDVDQLLQ